MASPDASESALQEGAIPEQKIIGMRPSYLIELLCVFVLALLIYGTQVIWVGPKLSLLFDSQGYLFTAQACRRALSPDILAQVSSYFWGGCHDEILRASIVSHLPGVLELVKSGPLLPGILLLAFGISGKSLGAEHWQVGAAAMLFLSSLGVVGIWGWARSLGGTAAGRIAALLAISYAGFAVNAGRILTELPSASISVFALFSTYTFVKSVQNKWQLSFDSQRETAQGSPLEMAVALRNQRRFSFTEFFQAFLPGALTGLLMLGRPTLLPWPVMMAACLFMYSLMSRNKRVFHPAAIIAFVLGSAFFIAPWSMVKQVLTGSPSIVIERYGPYNLSVGMNLRTDGFDALPSELVGHPERFKETPAEVLHHLAKQFSERPAAVIHLLLRKPARLLDAPWNDFQLRFFGIPILAQRFEHQLILLAAVLGVVLLLEHGRKRPDYLILFAGLMIGVFLSFQLVACAFITMSRYYVTAMPVAIVAASYFFADLLRQGRKAIQPAIGIVLAPLVSMLLAYLLVPGYGRLSDLSSDLGLAQLSLLAAFIMTTALSVGILLPAFTIFRGARSKLLLSGFTLIAGFSCFVTVCYQFMCSEAVLRLGAVDHERMAASINIPAGTNSTRWYLVIDANDATVQSSNEHPTDILSDMKVQFNGRELKPDWLPLLSMDKSMREESMYLAAFAYSCSKRSTDFRQWICAALPSENLACPGENKFVFSLADKQKTHPKIFADFADPMGKRIHSVSLRNFSWSKGFFADCPGEMRMDEWPNNAERSFDIFPLCGQASRLKPRAYLLGLKDNGQSESFVRSVNLANQEIGPKNLMSTQEISPVPGLAEFAANPGQSLRIRVSGQLKSKGSPTRASVCLLEGFRQGQGALTQEYAPLAPEVLLADQEWNDFAFEDVIVPMRTDAEGKPLSEPSKLESLKLHFLARPWWEVLDYGSFKGKGIVEFRNLKIELRGQPTLDLSSPDAHWLELNSQFEKNTQ